MTKYNLGLEDGNIVAKEKYGLIAWTVIPCLLFITALLYFVMGDNFLIILNGFKIYYLLVGTILFFYRNLAYWRYSRFYVNLSEEIISAPIEDSERPKNKILNWFSKQLYPSVELGIKDISQIEFGKKYIYILNTTSFPFKKITIPVSLENFDDFKKKLELARRK